MKKVLFYTENHVYGGLERFVTDFMTNAFSVGIQCELLFNATNTRLLSAAREAKIKHLPVKIKSPPQGFQRDSIGSMLFTGIYFSFSPAHALVDAFCLLWNFRLLRKTLKKYRVDFHNLLVVNGGHPGANSCHAAVWAAHSLRYENIVLSILSCPMRRNKWSSAVRLIDNLLDKRTFAAVQRITPNCKTIGTQLISLRGAPSPKVRPVYTGVTPKKVSLHKKETIEINGAGFSRSANDIWIGMPSFLGLPKTQECLINAMHYVSKQNKDVKCIIVGDGPMLSRLKESIEQLGLQEAVFLPGKFIGDIDDVYRFLDFAVFSSSHEGFPYSVLEPMSLGIPVIASAVGGVVEQIEDGVSGYLVLPQDPRELAEKILFLSEHRELWQTIGLNANKKVIEEFTIDIMMQKMSDCFI